MVQRVRSGVVALAMTTIAVVLQGTIRPILHRALARVRRLPTGVEVTPVEHEDLERDNTELIDVTRISPMWCRMIGAR
jgi:hypothetical protein